MKRGRSRSEIYGTMAVSASDRRAPWHSCRGQSSRDAWQSGHRALSRDEFDIPRRTDNGGGPACSRSQSRGTSWTVGCCTMTRPARLHRLSRYYVSPSAVNAGMRRVGPTSLVLRCPTCVIPQFLNEYILLLRRLCKVDNQFVWLKLRVPVCYRICQYFLIVVRLLRQKAAYNKTKCETCKL